MQKTIYTCDHCERIIGNQNHISVNFGVHSGIAIPPAKENGYWTISPGLQGNFKHFCNSQCIGQFFKELMNPKVDKQSKPRHAS